MQIKYNISKVSKSAPVHVKQDRSFLKLVCFWIYYIIDFSSKIYDYIAAGVKKKLDLILDGNRA